MLERLSYKTLATAQSPADSQAVPKRKQPRKAKLAAGNPARRKRFIEAREAVGLVQEDVAAATGVSAGSISRIEKHGSVPAGDTLVKLAALYKRSPSWLMTGQELLPADVEPYEGFNQFMASDFPEKQLLADWMVDMMKVTRFPIGYEPTAETYLRMLMGYVTVRPEH